MINYSKVNKFEKIRKQLLSAENNLISVKKESALSIALVFPNSYAVGMANLGFQSVYKLFNENDSIRCERAFFDQSFPTRTRTLESGSELRYFDVVAFSISFELDIPNVIQILIESGITPLADKRDEKEPIILLGGAVAFLNPEPLAPFADVIVLGELEPVFESLTAELLEYKNSKLEKEGLYQRLGAFDGFYIPRLKERQTKIRKVFEPLKNRSPHFSVITSPKSHFKDMFLIEVGRGCGRRCNFCAASHIYHPYRIYSRDMIIETIKRNINDVQRIGLIGAALSDYPSLFDLCENLVSNNLKLGLSSFRLDMISPQFLDVLQRGDVKSLAFAPEAGSERMRKLINKQLSENEIITAAKKISQSKISHVKLYFLIGLPAEQDNDIDEIIKLSKEIYKILVSEQKEKKLSLSINAFIPKPWTPFQWAPFHNLREIKEKRKRIFNGLKGFSNLEIIKKSAREELLQAVFSLGDRKAGMAAYFKITEKLTFDEAWEKAEVDLQKVVFQQKKLGHQFPWSFIETGLHEAALFSKWMNIQAP